LKELAPTGSAPHERQSSCQRRHPQEGACGCPISASYAFRKSTKPGKSEAENTRPLGAFLRDVMKLNMNNFRVFGPDETTSNKLDAIYAVSKKFWIEERFPEDDDGGELATDGRVMEMLSEHTMEGMLEGYLLTGRHGFLSPTKRSCTSSIPCSTSTPSGWRSAITCPGAGHRFAEPADHVHRLAAGSQRLHPSGSRLPRRGGQQERGRHAHLSSARRELPALGGRPLPAQQNYVNVIVSDKQMHLQYMDMDAAISTAPRASASGIGPAPTRAANPTW
jgi:xylulose-5-phosphate/fructose-6-phosphate phosphoketolase